MKNFKLALMSLSLFTVTQAYDLKQNQDSNLNKYVSIQDSHICFCDTTVFDMTTDDAKLAIANLEMPLVEKVMIEGNLSLTTQAKDDAKLAWYNEKYPTTFDRMQTLTGSALFVGSIMAYALYNYLYAEKNTEENNG